MKNPPAVGRKESRLHLQGREGLPFCARSTTFFRTSSIRKQRIVGWREWPAFPPSSLVVLQKQPSCRALQVFSAHAGKIEMPRRLAAAFLFAVWVAKTVDCVFPFTPRQKYRRHSFLRFSFCQKADISPFLPIRKHRRHSKKAGISRLFSPCADHRRPDPSACDMRVEPE